MSIRLLHTFPMILFGMTLGCNASPEPSSTVAGPPLSPDQVLSTFATVQLAPVEVGCWVLETPKGYYTPTVLPAQFRTKGLQVHVVVRGVAGVTGFCPGEFVSVDSIRAR
jgi:hypothetical protein